MLCAAARNSRDKDEEEKGRKEGLSGERASEDLSNPQKEVCFEAGPTISYSASRTIKGDTPRWILLH